MLAFSLIFITVLLVAYLVNTALTPKPRYYKPPQIEKKKPTHLKLVKKENDEVD